MLFDKVQVKSKLASLCAFMNADYPSKKIKFSPVASLRQGIS
jgi:hypothetical protein